MSRIRSPGYPSISITEAIELARKIYDKNRHNVTERDAAVRDMGYKGLTGQSTKMLADLSHYRLIERAGKGGMRVSELTARILHPHNPQEYAVALQEAAYAPDLFTEIRQNWPDGYVSENSLKAYLMRKGFSSAALPPALRSYTETASYLRQELGTESHRQEPTPEPESAPSGSEGARLTSVKVDPIKPSPAPPPQPSRSGVELMAGERVVFVEEAGASKYLKLIASGEFDADMIDALENFVQRQKRRLVTRPVLPSPGNKPMPSLLGGDAEQREEDGEH